jgi:hypothetical protein
MEQALSFSDSTRPARRALPALLFSNPWSALAIPLLLPLLLLF